MSHLASPLRTLFIRLWKEGACEVVIRVVPVQNKEGYMGTDFKTYKVASVLTLMEPARFLAADDIEGTQ